MLKAVPSFSALDNLRNELNQYQNPEKAMIYKRFFKAEHAQDQWLGIAVPILRKTAKNYCVLPLDDLAILLHSEIHEERLIALFILIHQYRHTVPLKKAQIYRFYIRHIKQINNWDLVDLSAPYILGDYLFQKDKKILMKWALSKNLWIRRIAMLTTFYFIRQNKFKDALSIAEKLAHDSEDLIHKAVGWMLREIGKRDLPTEEKFLKKHYRQMPRTMLRYAIEKFPETKRKKYMKRS